MIPKILAMRFYLADVLRNEKPIWWTEESKILWTSTEAGGVGEESRD